MLIDEEELFALFLSWRLFKEVKCLEILSSDKLDCYVVGILLDRLSNDVSL